MNRVSETWRRSGWVEQTQVLLDSYRKWVGRELIPRTGTPTVDAEVLFKTSIVVVSHGTQADPILNYGNRAALKLWHMDADEFLATPSRLTAEPDQRNERSRLLERTVRDGFVDDYQGIRVTSTGRRFRIDRAVVWNLLNADGDFVGQAATFSDWVWLPEQA